VADVSTSGGEVLLSEITAHKMPAGKPVRNNIDGHRLRSGELPKISRRRTESRGRAFRELPAANMTFTWFPDSSTCSYELAKILAKIRRSEMGRRSETRRWGVTETHLQHSRRQEDDAICGRRQG
jgi:hypothetical protein